MKKSSEEVFVLTCEIHDHEHEGGKDHLSGLEFFLIKFLVSLLCLKLSQFNSPPLKDPHNKRPLIDS